MELTLDDVMAHLLDIDDTGKNHLWSASKRDRKAGKTDGVEERGCLQREREKMEEKKKEM